MLVAIIYLVKMYLILFESKDLELMLQQINRCFVFLGIALTFSTLQDPEKTQNKFSRKIYENPKKGKVFIGFVWFMSFLLLILGLIGFLTSGDHIISELSFGILSLGIAFIGVLKVAIEMFENHRLDKKTTA